MGGSTLPIKHFDLIVPLGVFLLLLLEFILLILVREGNLYACYKSTENSSKKIGAAQAGSVLFSLFPSPPSAKPV